MRTFAKSSLFGLLFVILAGIVILIIWHGQSAIKTASTTVNDSLINYTPVPVELAEENIKIFLNDPDANVSYCGNDSHSYMLEDYYLFKVMDNDFKVNMRTGEVEDAWIHGPAEENVTLTEAQARDIGLHIASSKYANFSNKNMVLTCVRIQYTTPTADMMDYAMPLGREYWIGWHEFIEGVETQSYIFITINPCNGALIRYSAADRPIWISLEPAISHEHAVDIARKQFNASDLREIRSELVFRQWTRDEQKLMWEIELRGKPNRWSYDGGYVSLDAKNGTVYAVKEYDIESFPSVTSMFDNQSAH